MTTKVILELNEDVIQEIMRCERREKIRRRQKKSETSMIDLTGKILFIPNDRITHY